MPVGAYSGPNIPDTGIVVSETSNIHQNDIGNSLGLGLRSI